MSDRKSVADSITDIMALYHRSNMNNSAEKTAVADVINASPLPQFHKEALQAALLSDTDSEAIISIELLKHNEQLRHLDSMNKVIRRGLNERIKKIIKPKGP